MFDVSFSELMLIGIVALVVIGPQRLPTVARTIGHLVGRAQRYVNDVKSDIQREMDLDELRNLKGQMEDAARTVQASLEETSQELQQAKDSLADAAHSMQAELQAPLKNAEEKVAQAAANVSEAAAAAGKPVEIADAAGAAPALVDDTQKSLPGFAEASALAEAEPAAPPTKSTTSTPSGTPT
ncbi:Sec-independent protein translocase protein TatB [Candidimonas humi]|uniref:Sec-independent protein translocase protein TatB n=1 Tax=Candidimonas humi TaxID=683355 RepID=A0ABV8P0Y8_9BURK|nr:Sec-independent protein translocase protein TatB [Candidimonas humi]MBV6305462.1 Sec-independent protein translocase protein TatB [Candidimonas humi]